MLRRLSSAAVIVCLIASSLVLATSRPSSAADGPPICTPETTGSHNCIVPNPDGTPPPPPQTVTSGMTITLSATKPFHWCPAGGIPFSELPCTKLQSFSPGLSVYNPDGPNAVSLPSGVNFSPVDYNACSAWEATSCTYRVTWYPQAFVGTITVIANPGMLTVLDGNLTANPPPGCQQGNNLCYISQGGTSFNFVGTGGPPVASFTSGSDGANAGLVHFASTSTDPLGSALTAQWNFGDGGSGTGTTADHTYTKPGTYPVKLTVTNQQGQTASKTQNVVVQAPELSVAVDLLDGVAPPIAPDTEVRVKVTVSAGSYGVGSLSQLKFDGGVLAVSPEDAFTVDEGPTPTPPAAGFTLAPGARRAFQLKTTTAAVGRYTLSSAVRGKNAANANVSTTGTSRGEVANPSALNVTITPEHDTLQLRQNDDGSVIAQNMVVTFSLENTSDEPITDVEAQPSDLAAADPQHPYDDFPADWVGENDTRSLGTIAAHQTKSFTRTLKLTGDGNIVVKQLVLSSDGVSNARGPVKLTQKILLKMSTRVAEGWSTNVKAGGTFRIAGSFENLSNEEELNFPYPMKPLLGGNVGGGYISVDDGDAVPTPLAGKLEPREKKDFGVRMRTMRPSGEDFFAELNTLPEWTQGTVTFLNPYVQVKGEDGEPKVLINGTVLDGASYDLNIDASEPPPSNPWRNEEVILGVGGAGLERIQEILDSYWGVLDRVVQFGFDEQYRNETMGDMARTVQYLYEVLHNLSGEDFERLAQEVTAKLTPVLTGETGDAIRAAVYRYSQKVQQAYLYGDQAQIFDAARPVGRASGELVATFTLDEAVGRLVVKAINARRVYQEAATLRQIQQREQIFEKSKSSFPELEAYYKAEKELPPDVVAKYMTTTEIQQAEALDKAGIQSVAKPNEVGPTRLVEGGLATRKGEEIKNKTMATVEKLVFGGGPDIGKVLLRSDMPATEAEVKSLFERALAAHPDDLHPEDLAAAKQIWKNRVKEWKGYNSGDLNTELGRLKQWEKLGKIPFDFQALDNGINLKKKFGYLKFALEEGVDDAGKKLPGYWVLKMEDPISHKLLPISGDVDFLFFMAKSGLSIDAGVRKQIYESLLQFLTFLHPETGSWVADLSKKIGIFAPHFRDGQALITVKNGRWFAVKIDERFTRFRPGTTDQFYLHLAGIPADFDMLKHLAPFTWAESTAKYPEWMPITAFRKMFLNQGRTGNGGGGGAGGGSGGGGGGSDGATYEPAAGVYRGTEQGVVQRWNAETGWVDDPGATQELAAGTFVLAPQTATSVESAPGDDRVEIVSREDGGVGGSWFDVGDRVVLDPGGPNEEIATISGFGSLIFASGLTKPHRAGELVAQLEPARPDTAAGTASTPTSASSSASSSASGSLPRTGGDTIPLTQTALAVLGAGLVLTGYGRRRRRTGWSQPAAGA